MSFKQFFPGKPCLLVGVILLAASALSGCSTFPREPDIQMETAPLVVLDSSTRGVDLEDQSSDESDDNVADESGVLRRYGVPRLSERGELFIEDGAFDDTPAPLTQKERVNTVIPPLPLNEFVDTVFGEMLEVPYVTGEGVAARNDVIQLRSAGELSSEAFLGLITSALRDYGVAVYAEGGVYRIVQDTELMSRMPIFIKSRSRPDTPAALRPIVQFVELQAIAANEMSQLLAQAFPDTSNLSVDVNQSTNSLTLTGLRDDIAAALRLIDQFDDLDYAGTQVERYTPVFWSASDLSDELYDILRAEGWQVSNNASVQRTILLMPVEYSNDVLVFAKSLAASQRVQFWINQLDRPAKVGDVPQLFVYKVRNTDATLLADSARAVLYGTQPRLTSPTSPAGVGQNLPQTGNASPIGQVSGGPGSNIVVEPLSNQIIFSGTASDYDRFYTLLQRLDQPPPEVLIDLTIAEITITDDTRYGLEFLLNETGYSVSSAGLGLGSGGFDLAILDGDFRADFNLFAQNDRVKVLSAPRLIARSGGSAQIQVGQDVPIITSQRAAASQDGTGGTDVLQTVDYRSTGVLMSIEPIVLGQNRVDLNINAEVSTALSTTTSQISSPTISNRNLTTELSLEDGTVAVLGGLIQENTTRNQQGTPFLKDVPLLGRAFRNDTVGNGRTELVVLITAYILRDSTDRSQLVRQFTDNFNRTAADAENLDTLVPNEP